MLQKIALTVCVLFIAAAASAPIPQITEETQAPSPGTGHDYIQGLNETVNPSNGALTLKFTLLLNISVQLSNSWAARFFTLGLSVPSHVLPQGF